MDKTVTNRSTQIRIGLGIALSLLLAGCAQGLDGLVATHDSDTFLRTGSVTETTLTTALASLPREAGRVLSVREQRRTDGLQQHIVLSGDALASGENWIKVDIAVQQPSGVASHHQVHREMQAVFNGHALPIHNYILTNEHGPVGLAFGPVPNQGNCAYIWQEADQADVQATDQLPFARAAGVWSVRARLCRERLTQDHCVAFAQGLSLGAFSDPLYAPLASSPSNPQDVASSSLASLDEVPVVRVAQRSQTRTAPPNPVARAPQTLSPSLAQASEGSTVPIALPQDQSPQRQMPTESPVIQETAIVVPLPQ
ncbi:MAG: cellulose biosynthesis protein BcsN [Pseudomonadota bacterium]